MFVMLDKEMLDFW